MGNYINISFAVNLIEVFFFNFLLSLKDKQVDRRRMLTLGSQADVDKAGRYHLTKNEILGRSSSGKGHLREPKMKTVPREILSTQSLCQERPPQPQKEPTVYISSNIILSLKAPNCPGRLYIRFFQNFQLKASDILATIAKIIYNFILFSVYYYNLFSIKILQKS